MANRRRRAMNLLLLQQGSQQRLTSSWTSTGVRSEPANAVANSSAAGDSTQPHPAHTPSFSVTVTRSGRRAVYPVTEGKDYCDEGEKLKPAGDKLKPAGLTLLSSSCDKLDTAGSRKAGGTITVPTVPQISVTDCSSDDVVDAKLVPSADRQEIQAPVETGESPRASSQNGVKPAAASPVKSTTILIPSLISPPYRGMTQPTLSRPVTEPLPSSGPSVVLPPMARSLPTSRPRRLFTFTTEPKKRLASASSSLWPGDPRAIRSVRRGRRNMEEMLATMKAGEETRRLIREANPPCSRHCSQTNILTEMERTYVNLPDLLPMIEKARQRMVEQETAAMDQQDLLQLSSAQKRRVRGGRFDLAEDDATGDSENLPIYQINYNSLREIGGTRRNSVFA